MVVKGSRGRDARRLGRARSRYNLRTARRVRTAGLTMTGVLVIASFVMTCGYLHRVSQRSSAVQTVLELSTPPIGPPIGPPTPTDDNVAVFVSLFPVSPPQNASERAVAAPTEVQQPEPNIGNPPPVGPMDPVGPIDPEQRVITDRSAPIGTIATSRGEYTIHRDTRGRVFAERIFGEPSPSSVAVDSIGVANE